MVVHIHLYNQSFIMVFIPLMLQIMVSFLSLSLFFLASNFVFILANHFENRSMGSICLTRDVLTSHLYGSRRSTDGKHYIFAVQLANYTNDKEFIVLSNQDACLALPTYFIIYQRQENF
jgi:hypothetical protein